MTRSPPLPAHRVFDLDGTLSDPAEGIWRSINHALQSAGHALLSREAVGIHIGPPLDVAFRRIAGIVSDEAIAALVGRYRERYAEVGYAENVLYPGIAEALQALREDGQVLGVCTSKRADFADRILRRFGIREHFAFVSGGDIGIAKTTQLRALRAEGRVGADAVMIGDRDIDILAARDHGLRAVAVLWGYGSPEELEAAAPDRLLRSPAELSELGGAWRPDGGGAARP